MALPVAPTGVTSILVTSVGGWALPRVGIRPCLLGAALLQCSFPACTTLSMLTPPVGIPFPVIIQSCATPAATFASIPVPQLLLMFHTALGALPGESLGSPSCSPEHHSLVDQQVLVGVLWLCSAVPRAFPHGCVAVAALRVAFPWGHRGKRRAAPWEGRVEEEVPRDT